MPVPASRRVDVSRTAASDRVQMYTELLGSLRHAAERGRIENDDVGDVGDDVW
ncbi:hypothetical protein FB558_4433 [Pseudonocardia kunmingensis]|uniref:Uncharacterized protein n=1 Tax=Pseudonocardia kunmingensis TaxID=630975 RepID=A0A543DRB0_9PSEU|nr:hypothetical protein FB558_4433 [Pseudonocardia kunmingensis]